MTFYKITTGDPPSYSSFQWEQGSPPDPTTATPLTLVQDTNRIITGAQYHLNLSVYVALTVGCADTNDALRIFLTDPNDSSQSITFTYAVCTAPSGVWVDVSYSFYGNAYMVGHEFLQFIFAIKSIGYVRLDNISIKIV